MYPDITKYQVSDLIILTSCHAIVKDGNDGEENVKVGEDYEEKVERVSHLLGGKNTDGETISQDTETPNTSLKRK